MEYREPASYTRKDILSLMSNGNKDEICDMLVGIAYNEPDLRYAYFLICKFIENEDLDVKGLALLCLAHLARIHGEIPVQNTIDIFSNIISGPYAKEDIIKSRIGDAVGDFRAHQKEIYDKLVQKFPEYFEQFEY